MNTMRSGFTQSLVRRAGYIGALLLALALAQAAGVRMTLAAPIQPSAAGVCPPKLVCLSIDEAAQVAKIRAHLEEQVSILRAAKPHKWGWSATCGPGIGVIVTASPGDYRFSTALAPVSIGCVVGWGRTIGR